MTKVTLLSKKDLETETLKKLGVQCQGTDFASKSQYTSYWTCSEAFFESPSNAYGYRVTHEGELHGWGNVGNGYGVRPVLIPDNFDEIIQSQKPREDGLSEVLYGEYPQKTSDIQEELDASYESKKVNQTGKEYTVPYSAGHREYKLFEYEYKGKKYVYNDYDYEWTEVTSIEWIVDEKNKRFIAKKVLLTGVPLNYINRKYDEDFETSSLYEFLNNQFINEIIPSVSPTEIEQATSLEMEKNSVGKGQYVMKPISSNRAKGMKSGVIHIGK